MNDPRRPVLAHVIESLASRRDAFAAIMAGGSAASLAVLGNRESEAKKRRKKKTCKAPKRKCGQKCVSLVSSKHCGGCSTRCTQGTSCLEGVCCAGGSVNCRGNCRVDCPPPVANRPFPQRLTYGASKPNLWTQDQLDNHVRAAYASWKSRYLIEAGRDGNGNRLCRVALGKPGSDGHKATVSEGQGYGMVIVATMAGHDPEAQEVFDGLWRFSRAHPSVVDSRLMDWNVPGKDGNDSAFDGDCDMAYGLLLATAQFGSGGSFDYRAELDRTLAGILASTIGPASRLPMLGDWVDANGGAYNQYTPRTSDFMPGHFRAFGRATGNGVWASALAACQDVVTMLQTNFSATTGLLPDFVQPQSPGNPAPRPASPNFLEGAHDGDYSYNAGRDPWRLGTDALINGDLTSGVQARKISDWAKAATAGNPNGFRSGYRLDGSTWNDTNYFTTFFVAPLGVAAMTDARSQNWVNAIYGAVFEKREDYFEDSVTLLCLLVMTGNFWDPTR